MKMTAKAQIKRALALLVLCALFLSSSITVFAAPPALSSEADPGSAASSSPPSSSAPPAEGESAAQSEAGEPGQAEPPPAGPSAGLYAPPFDPAAPAVCIINEDTGAVVYAKNADTPLSAASLVKMMTAILVMDDVADLDNTFVTCDKSWVYDELYGKNASTADIRKGETLSVRELLYALLLPSANEAALFLADHVSGGYMKNFLYMMNTRAAMIGCTGTNFEDANGLNEASVTTARDMCLITREFMKYPELVKIAGTPVYLMAAHEKHSEAYNIVTTNRLIAPTSPYYKAFANCTGAVVAGKTGSLGEWQNFASMAESNGLSYICTVLNAPNAADPIGQALDPPQARPGLYESAQLYDWAFSSFSVRPALDVTQPINEVPVRYSTQADSLRLLPSEDLRALLPVDASDSMIDKVFELPEYVAAPIQEGDVIGTVTLSLAGQVIGTANLLAERNVARNNTLYTVRKVQEFAGSTYLKVLIAVVLGAAAMYAGAVVLLHRRRQKQTAKSTAARGGFSASAQEGAPARQVKRPSGEQQRRPAPRGQTQTARRESAGQPPGQPQPRDPRQTRSQGQNPGRRP